MRGSRAVESGWVSALALGAIAVAGCTLIVDGNGSNPEASDASSPENGDAAPGGCPPQYTLPFEGSRYRLTDSVQLNWYQAEQTCEEDGAHLVVIETQSENDFLVAQQFSGWIGASDHQTEGSFRWVTDAAVPLPSESGFQTWESGEPDNQFSVQDCVLSSAGQWSDASCESQFAYACECDGTAPLDPPTWCRTGEDTDCNECGDDCDGLTCSGQQCGF